jgi:hypothetical protein
MREFDEMCMAAAKLRRRIQRDMRATRAREEIGSSHQEPDGSRLETRIGKGDQATRARGPGRQGGCPFETARLPLERFSLRCRYAIAAVPDEV